MMRLGVNFTSSTDQHETTTFDDHGVMVSHFPKIHYPEDVCASSPEQQQYGSALSAAFSPVAGRCFPPVKELLLGSPR